MKALTNGDSYVAFTVPAPGLDELVLSIEAKDSGNIQVFDSDWKFLANTGEFHNVFDWTVKNLRFTPSAGKGLIIALYPADGWLTVRRPQLEHDALEDLNQVRAASLHRAFKANGALAPDGRAETRRLLGLDSTVTDPYEADAAIAAAQAVAESTTDEPEPSIRLPAGVDATSLETLLAEHAAEIQTAREKFTGAITPPITDRR